MAAPVTRRPPAVPDGPRAHRSEVRRRGPFLALLVPAVCGLAAVVVLWGNNSVGRAALGVVLAVAAAPLLPLFGAPMSSSDRVLQAVAASAVLWVAMGWLAAHRATRVPGASWPEWRREFRPLALGLVGGGLAALALAGLLFGGLAAS